jgi:UDP-glucose 4-epimerase
LAIFGDDYPTADGTCVRDYIHVNDLADAHVLALQQLTTEPSSFAVNLGTGRGSSVLEVLKTVKEVTQKPVRYKMVPRRPGDPPSLVADPSRAQQLLRWAPSRSLHDIVATAWKWKQRYEASTAE